jgi:hypothetical protein
VDGVLSILFAVLIVVVIADAARVWLQILSGRREPTLSEAPAEPSRLWAPAGLIPTAEDRARGEFERRRMDALDERPAARCCCRRLQARWGLQLVGRRDSGWSQCRRVAAGERSTTYGIERAGRA